MPNVSQATALSTPVQPISVIAVPNIPPLPGPPGTPGTSLGPNFGSDSINDLSTYNPALSNILGISPTATASTPSATQSAISSGVSGLNNLLGTNILGGVPTGGTLTNLFGAPIQQVGTFLLGLIFIAGGIYLFKPVSEAVNRAVRTGTRAASV